MNEANITPAERIAALQEQNDRLSDRTALAEQMRVCADNRDALADQLNVVIDERDELRARITEMEARNVELTKSNQNRLVIIEGLTARIEELQNQLYDER